MHLNRQFKLIVISALCSFIIPLSLSKAQEKQGVINRIPPKGSSQETWQEWRRNQRALAKRLGVEDEKYGIHNGNRIETIFYNYGTVSDPAAALDIVWPKGSGHGYGFEFGIIGGSKVVDINGGVKYILSEHITDGGDRSPGGVPWGWQPLPGYANPDQQLLAMSDCEDNDGPDGEPNSGDDDGWPDCWPRSEHYQDWGFDLLDNPFYDAQNNRYVWPGEYGFDVLTADQESYYFMDDLSNIEFKYYPFVIENYRDRTGAVDTTGGFTLTDLNASFQSLGLDVGESPVSDVVEVFDDAQNRRRYYYIESVDSDTSLSLQLISSSPQSIEFQDDSATYILREGSKRGLGLQVEARGYQWSHTLAQDCIFFIYDFENISDETLVDVYFAMYGDPHVGGKNNYDDDYSGYDTQIDMVYSWDEDMEGDGGFRPGYFGYSFLESPGDPDNGIDDDNDGLIDESMQDGIDNDNDWDAFDDYNNNGIWDPTEPLNDDLGADGLGPNHESYLGPDEGEADGMPTPGEPDFDETDLDEADQIGLTSFASMIYSSRVTPGQDGQSSAFWDRITSGIIESEIHQNADNVFIYSSGPITMAPEQRRRFSIALLLGYDEADLFRSANTVQEIYNAGYQFVKAPNKPNVTAVEGDGRITLYWDSRSERSYDPLYGNDFEGYAIYRATDIGFNDVFNITDAQGNPKLWNPIARFDLDNELSGPHPIQQVNGIHYYLGDNTGLSHTFTDSSVMNGQRYFYAVVAYDSGSASNNISPTETTKNIQVRLDGSINTDVNTVMVTPHAVSAGYQPPKIIEEEDGRHQGPGTGEIKVTLVDPTKIPENKTFQVRFLDTSNDGLDNDGDWEAYTDVDSNGVWDSGEPLNDDLGADGLGPSDTEYPGIDDGEGDGLPTSGEPNLDTLDYEEMPRYTSSYALFDITDPDNEVKILANSQYLRGEDSNPVLNGILLQVYNDTLQVDQENSKWLQGNSNLKTNLKVYNSGFAYSTDYHIFLDTVGVDTAINASKPANFFVWNRLDSDLNDNGQYDVGEPWTDFVFFDIDNNKQLTPGDEVVFIAPRQIGNQPIGTWKVTFLSPARVVSDIDKDGNDRYWFGTSEGLTEYADGEWIEHGVGEGVLSIYVDDLNYKWLGQNNRLSKYRFGTLTTVAEIPETRVNKIIRDNIGRLWIATATHGVYQYDGLDYTRFPADSNASDGLSGPPSADVRALAVNGDNDLYVGTTEGLAKYDGTDWSLLDMSGLSSQVVERLYSDESGTLWIGTLNELATSTDDNATAGVSDVQHRVRDIKPGPDNSLWIATTDGIYRTSDGAVWQRDTLSVNPRQLSANDVRSLELIDGRMYAGTSDGVDYYEDDTWHTFNPEQGDEFVFSTSKPFSQFDTYTFTTDSQFVSGQQAVEDLDDVAVVPNPYIATAVWEPRQNIVSGRGERRIWFIHLPNKGTIRIFTIAGELVKTIEFENKSRDGSVSWDLLNDDRLEIAFGVYLYQLDSPYGTTHGKFAIVK